MNKNILAAAAVLLLWGANPTAASENPDELYRQGRYAEAEEAYSKLDMDHPKDVRYRYNRGRAAYQKNDLQAARAAFSSVLMRAKDDELRFRSAYNLGHLSFQEGDFASAAEFYKRAIAYSPESEDARYNLELSLRQQAKQEQEKGEEHEMPPHEENGHEGEPQPGGEEGKEQDRTPGKESGPEAEGGEPEKTGHGEGKPEEERGPDEERKREAEPPRDLAGELAPRHEMAPAEGEDQPPAAGVTPIGRKEAEALLDNVHENRSRYLRFQVPEDQERGVGSGKEW
jgi:Ca-activated chloride channel family protein